MKFRFRPGLFAATTIAFAILCALGAWQVKRLHWKRSLIDGIETRLAADPIAFAEALAKEERGEDMEYQPVFIDGVYENDREAPVFGTYEGAPGVYVFTPLRTGAAGGYDAVYVNRGFAPQAFRDPRRRADGLVAGETRVTGLFRSAEHPAGVAGMLRPVDQPKDNLWFTRDPEIFAARHRLSVPSFYIDAKAGETQARWPEGGVTRVDIPNRHLEYALTWFGLAAALVGVYAAFSVTRE